MNYKELLTCMQNVVEKYVSQEWKSDFYHYDTICLSRQDDIDFVIWFVRDCGTYFIGNGKDFSEKVRDICNLDDIKAVYYIPKINASYGFYDLYVDQYGDEFNPEFVLTLAKSIEKNFR